MEGRRPAGAVTPAMGWPRRTETICRYRKPYALPQPGRRRKVAAMGRAQHMDRSANDADVPAVCRLRVATRGRTWRCADSRSKTTLVANCTSETTPSAYSLDNRRQCRSGIASDDHARSASSECCAGNDSAACLLAAFDRAQLPHNHSDRANSVRST